MIDRRWRRAPIAFGLSLLSLCWVTSYVSRATAAEGSAKPVDYQREIQPLLAHRCYTCHGPDAAKRQADLRLDKRESAVRIVIVPGKSSASPLLERISAKNPDERMPPPDSKLPPLADREIELLRHWIDQGAKFDAHWAYVKPARPQAPQVTSDGWPLNPIDRFVLSRLEHEGLQPSAEADRRTLIRRLYFDLIGLPPKPEDVEAFLSDKSADAYEKLVDRTLSSPHFGERMAVYWLDLARYGDTGGYHSDNDREVWLFRDYVIQAFNANKRFDQFTIEQLAGDLLDSPTREQKIASGYNRMLLTTEEGGAQPKEYTAKYAADRVRNTAVAWLGATMGCCECHDHKYDPYTTKDFYRFEAFFADVKEIAVGRQEQTKMPTAEQAAALKKLDDQISTLEKATDAKTNPKLAELRKQRENLEKTFPTTLISQKVEPRTIRVLPRGNWLSDAGEIVEPAIPEFLGKLDTGKRRATRLDLARWFTSGDNPLVARVLMNRLWKIAFGQGIVKTLDDCGTQGARPTHPELLDWLAVEFIESGWDVKHMVRLMVTSRTYRQTSIAGKVLMERDPGNQWLARQGRFRLDAEFVRDNALAVSGLLSPKIGGPSVKPYQPAGYWDYLNFPVRQYVEDQGENQYRRGLYTFWQRTFLHPSLLAFDAPTREECAADRARSNTPLQSLVLLNDPTYVEAARVLAQRMVREGGSNPTDRVGFAFRQTLARAPQPAELRLLTDVYEKHRKQYSADEKAARELLQIGQAKSPSDIPAVELASNLSVARVILNLHETVTRY